MRYRALLLARDTGTRRICSARLGRRGRGLRGRGAAASRHGGDVALSGKPIGQAATVRPPFLKAGRLVIAHTANILFFLGPRLGLVPKDEAGRLWAHQLQLTIADWVAEVHDTHHPVASSSYYEEQKREAKRRAENFRAERLPKFLNYFEGVLERNGRRVLVGNAVSYPDLSLFQMIEGLRYAFPCAMKKQERKYRRTIALHDRVAARPRLAGYLSSERRLPFNQEGIFRHYPELDDPS